MGKLGGTVLGHDGLSALRKEPGLAIGEGVELDPDGIVGGDVNNLLINSIDNLFINDMGDVRLIGSPSANGSQSFSMASGLNAAMTARNGQTFANVATFTETSPIPFNSPANGDKAGYWTTLDVINGAQPFDLRFTFAWTSDATGPPDVRVSPCVLAPSLSVDGLSPFLIGPLIDRNNPLIFPSRFGTVDLDSGGALTNAGPNYVPTGSELTADGTTLHTCGFSVDGLTYRAFFDGTEIDNMALTASERADLDFCARVGVWYFNDGETELHYRHSLLEVGAAGTIYP